jgi:hypothetical protein
LVVVKVLALMMVEQAVLVDQAAVAEAVKILLADLAHQVKEIMVVVLVATALKTTHLVVAVVEQVLLVALEVEILVVMADLVLHHLIQVHQ